MLFNSYAFLFAFLPLTILGLFLCQRRPFITLIFIQIASLIFYSYWPGRSIFILLISVAFNFTVGRGIIEMQTKSRPRAAGWVLTCGITGDLALLAYYKYAGFFIDTLDGAFGLSIAAPRIILPLAVSFFTFEQISYLVDLWKGLIKDHRASTFLTFALFFPRLLAGPIIRFNDVAAQLVPQGRGPRLTIDDFNVGTFLFAIGLFKKVVFGDGAASIADPVFTGAETGVMPSASSAICATLAFGLQIYFDFSGYSDMAIGLARMMGIRLPINFASPYKAGSMIDFWRRWHISLSTFLRDYLYIPLGGSRYGMQTRLAALMATMLLGGLWHGAGWTFVIWGGLHGALLCVNHLWRAHPATTGMIPQPIGWALTMICVFIAWIFFRAPNLDVAISFLVAMSGADGGAAARVSVWTFGFLLMAVCIVLFAPNSQQIVDGPRDKSTVLQSVFCWQPTQRWAGVAATLITVSLFLMSRPNKFIYFQF